MNKIRTSQILFVVLMGTTCLVMAADPFQVSVQLVSSNSPSVSTDDGQRTTDDSPEKTEDGQL